MAGMLGAPSATAASCDWDQSPGWVQRENAKTGTAEWDEEIPLRFSADFTRRKTKPRVEGYFGATSVGCGEKTSLTIIGAPSANISIYRIGYYKGAGARLVMTVNSAKSFIANAKTPPGEYLVKLKSPGRASSFVPIVVRSQSIKSDITFISSVLTWQAYNQWGGTSLYKGADGTRNTRGESVTFDRPFDGDGAGQFRYMEEPLVQLIEQVGIDTNYITDIDLDKAERINSGSVVLGGHSEFWSYSMRSVIEKAVLSGINLIVLGGNSGYAQTLIDNRLLIGRNPFRDLGMPESKILGSQFFALGIRKDLESQNTWPFSVLGRNAVIKGAYGYEADTAMGTIGPGVEILARATISPTEKGFVAMSTYYSASSGARVLNIGTIGWVCGMSNRCPWGHTFDRQAQQQIKLVTAAILKAAKSGKWRVAKIDIPTRS
jgi:hypothetical protein